MKICGSCKKDRMVKSFSPSQLRQSSSLCRRCIYAYNKKYQEKFPEKYNLIKKNSNRNYYTRLLAARGVDDGFYDRKFKEQDGKCAICNSQRYDRTLRRFAIDHCHKTNLTRGLLCSSCNRALGYFKDNQSILNNAIEYLRSYS